MSRLLLILFFAGAVLLRAESAGSEGALPLTREQFLAALVRDLASHFKLEGELQLELVRAWSPPPRAARHWVVNLVDYPAGPAASMLLRCRILADDELVADGPVVVRGACWRDAWVTRTPVVNGAAFDASQLETRRTDFFRTRDAVPATLGDRTYLFARTLSPGTALTWHDLTRRPLVRKGDVVEVSAAEGRLLVTLKALALENGAQGDTITVRNPESQKNFAAVVINENRVQVRF